MLLWFVFHMEYVIEEQGKMGRILMESLISPLTPRLFDAVEKVKVNFIYIIIVIN